MGRTRTRVTGKSPHRAALALRATAAARPGAPAVGGAAAYEAGAPRAGCGAPHGHG
ncbi:hypothetical protein ABZY31_23005 [Streptomyces sp. NPDC006529]|uniref:hypothetical protein n=1 Tax=Streptomyces sp. NPDC006529 TaxID=3157177 RepID=UPI0033A1F610